MFKQMKERGDSEERHMRMLDRGEGVSEDEGVSVGEGLSVVVVVESVGSRVGSGLG